MFKLKLGLVSAILVPAALLMLPLSGAASASARPAKVLLVLVDKTSWADIKQARTPFIDGLIEKGAIGLLSNHTALSTANTARSYATISAGNRAASAIGSGLAFTAGEKFSTEDAAVVYERRLGKAPAGRVFHLGFPALDRTNINLNYGAKVGSLGEALKERGLKTAVFGHADLDRQEHYGREAAIIAADRGGLVDFGDVSRRLQLRDDLKPYGLKTNYRALTDELAETWRRADFVVVETGDSRRADQWLRYSDPRVVDKEKIAALERADAFLGELNRRVPLDDTLIMVVSPSPPLRSDLRQVQQLTPIITSGPGISHGQLRSNSTRRSGIVAGTDIAPTVLKFLGVEQPPSMTGRPMESAGEGGNIGELIAQNKNYVLADLVATPTIVTYVVLLIIVLLMALVLSAAGPKSLNQWRTATQKLLLAALAAPTALFAVPYIPGSLNSIWAFAITTIAIIILLTGLAMFGVGNRFEPPLIIVFVTVLFIAANMFFGAKGDLGSVLGYSPIVAGRFYGMGNQTMSVLLAAVLLLVVIALESKGEAGPRDKIVVAGLFVLTAVLIGWPALGANTGGVVAATVTLLVAYIHLFNQRIRWRQSGLAALGAAGVLALFVLADAYLLDAATHMGRTFRMVADGGWESLAQIVRRKALANVRIYKYTSWSYLLTTIFGLLAFVWWLQPRTVKERFVVHYRFFNSGLIACLVGGTIGGLVNDSGISIPALMLAYFLAVVFYILLDDAKQRAAEG